MIVCVIFSAINMDQMQLVQDVPVCLARHSSLGQVVFSTCNCVDSGCCSSAISAKAGWTLLLNMIYYSLGKTQAKMWFKDFVNKKLHSMFMSFFSLYLQPVLFWWQMNINFDWISKLPMSLCKNHCWVSVSRLWPDSPLCWFNINDIRSYTVYSLVGLLTLNLMMSYIK